MAQALLSLQEILVRYGDSPILDVPSLDVCSNDVLAVIGPNGAGKSTLLRVIGLLEKPSQGKVYFHGLEVTRADSLSVRRRMANAFQEPLLLKMSVYENAALGLKLRGFGGSAIERRVRPWLERLGISHLAKQPARGLSGGEAQRTSLARALVLDPELLLLDEPFSALDPSMREALLLDLEKILRDTGITTVFVTHDRDEASMLGSLVAVLIGGRILQLGPTMEIFTRPANEEIARFVGVDTKIPAKVEKIDDGLIHARFDGGVAEAVGNFQAGETVLLCLRPEDVTLSLPGLREIKSSARNRLIGRVSKITPWGAHYRVTVNCGGNDVVALIARPSFLDLHLRVGDSVAASFKATAVHVLRRR